MLTTKDVTYAYQPQQPLHFPDLHCETGAHWLLLGQSGSGKTTLLHLLGGLLKPRSGSIRLGDTELSKLNAAALDQFRGQHIGIVFQRPHFVPSLSVEENLWLAQHLAGLSVDKNRAESLLERLGIAHKRQSAIQQLSVGEQQRVAIARALINRPSLILADEPSSALDDDNSQRVVALLEEQAREVNASLLIVTHDNRLKGHFANSIVLAHQTTQA